MNREIEGLLYKTKKTSQMGNKEICDFIKTFNDVFCIDYDKGWYDWKYNNNIYGESYFILVYDNDKLVAARVFWRNDLKDVKAYQPVDTFVSKEYRKKGIFNNMNTVVLGNVDLVNIYNFPNSNSLPGNLKLGWKLKYRYNLHVALKRKLRNINLIEDKYLKWRFLDCPINNYNYYRYRNKYYLIKKRKSNLYYVLGEIKENYKKNLKEVKHPIMLYYSNQKNAINVFNNKANLVVKQFNTDIDYIPITKNDTI